MCSETCIVFVFTNDVASRCEERTRSLCQDSNFKNALASKGEKSSHTNELGIPYLLVDVVIVVILDSCMLVDMLLIVSLPVIIELVIELDIVSVMEEEAADEVATEFTVIAIRPVSPIKVATRMIIVPVCI